MFCVVYCVFRQLFEVECFRVFSLPWYSKTELSKEEKKRTDTLVLVITNYKQKHIIRGTTCEAFDCDSFQKTECSETWKETHEKSYFSVYKISEKVLEKSVEWRRTELHDQWAKLLSGLTVSVFSITVSVPTSTLTKLLNGMLNSMTRSWVDNESIRRVHVTRSSFLPIQGFSLRKGKNPGSEASWHFRQSNWR